ncbi:MAG: hypothetical protein F4160_20225 [Rhodospirillaceae bacterium]|nr:hypothetical protein [Rhodospirillaceae bacterium]MYF07957.1 hypothetical protein [Rhodospirillaceae bacterium]MYH39118.1 hypothetical protein [Rhodospirillaceae bacterium]
MTILVAQTRREPKFSFRTVHKLAPFMVRGPGFDSLPREDVRNFLKVSKSRHVSTPILRVCETGKNLSEKYGYVSMFSFPGSRIASSRSMSRGAADILQSTAPATIKRLDP